MRRPTKVNVYKVIARVIIVRVLSMFFLISGMISAIFAVPASSFEAESPSFTLYVNSSINTTPERDNIQQTGKYLALSRQYLDNLGVSYTLKYQPWPRIMKAAEEDKNVLISGIVRSKAREDNFIWLKKLQDTSFLLIGGPKLESLDLGSETIKRLKLMSVCETHSVQCGLLKDIGFPDDQILKIDNVILLKQVELFNRGRIDVIMAQTDNYQDVMTGTRWKEGPQKHLIKVIPSIEVYLAASRKSIQRGSTASFEQMFSGH